MFNFRPFKENKTNQLFDLAMVLTTVILFYFAFPSGGQGYLSWIAFVPVIIILNRSSSRNAFMLGLLAAMLGWMCSIWWAVNGISEITSTPVNLVIPVVFLLCFLSGLPYALGCWIHVRYKFGHSIAGAFKSAIIFTILINYIPHILPGNLAHALYLNPMFIQLADIGGVPLVVLIINLVNLLIAHGISQVKEEKNRNIALGSFVISLIIFLGNAGYGQYRLQQLNASDVMSDKKLTLAIIQPNIDISNRTRDDWITQKQSLSAVLSKVEKIKNIDLVILPEIPVPISYQYYAEDKLYFDQYLSNKPLLLTAIKPINKALEESDGYFNTMELISKNKVKQEYSKQVLLPFGEYIPFEKSMPWLRSIFPSAPNYKKGSQSTLLALKGKNNIIKAVPLICYEAVFSDLVAQGVQKGGELLINSSNDAWFNNLAGQNTHFALSVFRSIEYRKHLVRATNSGISGVINPSGALIDSSKIDNNTQGYSVNELYIKPLESFYGKYPNLVKYILLITALIVLFKGKKNVND